MLELKDESCLRFRKRQKNVPEKEHGTADAHNNVVLANHKLLQKWVGDKIKQGPGDWVSAVFTAGENLLCH